MRTRKENFPTGELDEFSGETIFYKKRVRELRKMFSVAINLELKSRVLDFPRTIKKNI